MACPVDAPALGHQEETLGTVQHFDRLADDFGEGRLIEVGRRVDGRLEGAVREAGHDLAVGRLERHELVFRPDDAIPLLGDIVIGVAVFRIILVLLRIRLLVESTAGKEVKAGVREVQRDAVELAAILAMGVETAGGRMGDRDRGHDADLLAGLLGDLRAGLGGLRLCVDPYRVIVGLHAAGDGRRRRGGIRHQRVGRARARRRLVRKRVHRQRTVADLARELFGDHTLRRRHAVADKQEDIFRSRGKGTECHGQRSDKN